MTHRRRGATDERKSDGRSEGEEGAPAKSGSDEQKGPSASEGQLNRQPGHPAESLKNYGPVINES